MLDESRVGVDQAQVVLAAADRADREQIGPGMHERGIGFAAPDLGELFREIAAVKPKVIVVLGNTACQNLLETKVGITKLRGEFHDYFGVKVMPTFHPAYLLRDPSKKRETWDDMKKVRDYLNEVS